MKTQDVSKKGLKYGDEDEDEAERKELNAHNIAFRPLIDWLRTELIGQISDGEWNQLTVVLSGDYAADRSSRLDQSTRDLAMYHHRR